MIDVINESYKPLKIKDVTPIYTGGGIYVYYGAFSDGTYFMAETPDFDLRIVDSDPRKSEKYEFGGWEADYPDWQEEHLVKDISNTDTQDFFNQMFDWILKNEPEGNYAEDEIEYQKKRNNDETGSGYDRSDWLN